MKVILSERAIGNWLRKWCGSKGHRVVKINPSNIIGFPDRLLMTQTGNVWFIELKSEGRTLRPMQIEWQSWMLCNNHNHLVLERVDDDVVRMLEEIII